MQDTQSEPKTGLDAIRETLHKRDEVIAIQQRAKAEEHRIQQGRHGWLYRDRIPIEDPCAETEQARCESLMNRRAAWN